MVDKDLGFVLKRFNFRETSVIVSLFTRRFGKIDGILKGFYTGKKEFSTSLDIFGLNEFVLYPRKNGIWLIAHADSIEDFSFLRASFSRNSAASACVKMVLRGLEMHDPHPEVFTLLKDTFWSFSQAQGRRVLFAFLIKFLTISGLKPEFTLCISCHNPYGEKIFFSASSGGLLCERCRGKKPDTCPISKEASSSITFIQKASYPEVLRLNPSRACDEEMEGIVRKFLLYHLDIDPFLTFSCASKQ